MGALPVTHHVDIYNLITIGDKEEYETTPSHTGVCMGIFPAGGDILAVYPGQSSYILFQAFTQERVLIKNGAKLIAPSNIWIVRAVPQIFDVFGHYHQELIIEQEFE